MKLILLIFLSTCTFAKTIRIAIAEDVYYFAPAYIEILKAIYKEVGLTVQLTVLPQQRALKEFNDGKFQAMAARIKDVTYVSERAIPLETPVIENFKYGLLALKNSPQSRLEKFDINKYKVLKVRGTVMGDIFESKYQLKHVSLAKSINNAIELLKRNRADFLIGSVVFNRSKEVSDNLHFMKDYQEMSSANHIIAPELLYLKPQIEEVFVRYKAEGKLHPSKLIKKD